MEGIRRRVTGFTLCFRGTYLSRIGMHNDVNQALRRALGTDWMLEELDRDSAQIDAFLEHSAAKRHERNFRWASVFGVFGIGWLTSFSIVKEVLELTPLQPLVAPDSAGSLAALVALGIALIAAVVTWLSGGGYKQGNLDHAGHETMSRKARR